MTIKWLVQDTDRMFRIVENDFISLKKLGFEVIPFGTIPFTNLITGLENLSPEDDYILRCGTKVISLLENNMVENVSQELLSKLKKGISHETLYFDQAYYTNLDLPMLNEKPEILDIKDNLYLSFDTDKFVKPTTDMKAFNAGILEAGLPLKNYIENGFHRNNYMDEQVLIGKCIHISGEYRFICIGNEIVGASRYQQNGRLVTNKDIPQDVYDKAIEYSKLYHPADIFTMDLCETNDGIKIVEYNCWNCSGLYDMDVDNLFTNIYTYYKDIKLKNNIKNKL